jgi:hypothetical protein
MRYPALLGGFLVGGLTLGLLAASHRPVHRQAVVGLPESQAPVLTLAAQQATATVAPAAVAATPSAAGVTPVPFVPTLTPARDTAGRPSPYGPNRLVIPALGINSTWMTLGYVPNTGVMDSPPGPQDLGWYVFSAQPGETGNTVFGGHVDWHTGEPALFGNLANLSVGAEVDISRTDGTQRRYHVVSSTWYNFPQTNAVAIIAPTETPTVTLITCGGSFDAATHEYDRRLVVRAVADGS